MKQNVLVACVIVSQSKVILMDEPFNGLDPMKQEDLVHVLNELKQSNHFQQLEPQTQDFILNRIEIFDGPLNESYVTKDMSPIEDYYTRRSRGMFDEFRSTHSCTDKKIIWVHNSHSYYDKKNDEYLNDEEPVFAYDHETFGELLKGYYEDIYTIGIILMKQIV